jgi:ABC-type amino acid transport substrate-binding protein
LKIIVILVTITTLLRAETLKLITIENAYTPQISAEVLIELYGDLGYELELYSFPSLRAEISAKSGNFIGEASRVWKYGEDNSEMIRVPTPITYIETSIFYRVGNEITINTLNDLSKYKVAIPKDAKHVIPFKKYLDQYVEVYSSYDLVNLLSLSRVDIAIGTNASGSFHIKNGKFDDIKIMKPPLQKIPIYHYLHKNYANLLSKIDSRIISAKNSGKLDSLLKIKNESYFNERIKDKDGRNINSDKRY